MPLLLPQSARQSSAGVIHHPRTPRALVFSVFIASLLASACGGGGGDGGGPVTPPTPTAPTISLNATTAELAGLGSTTTATATVSPASATVSWRSETPAVATVSGTGTSATITAVGAGSATIVAEAVNSTLRAEARLTVTVRAVARGVDVQPATAALQVGQTRQLTATVSGDAGIDTRVTWRSTVATIATIDSTGLVTAVAPGTTLMIASSRTTDRTGTALMDTSIVTVSAAPRVRSVTIAPTTDTVLVGQARLFTATVTADSGLARTVTWRSGNSAVATVAADGRVTTIGAGTTSITAIATADTTMRASATLVVRTPVVRSITVLTVPALEISDTAQLVVNVSADSGADTRVSYLSAAPTIATVSATGRVIAVATGTTTITVSSIATPAVTAAAAITVKAPAFPTRWTSTYDARLGEAEIVSQITDMQILAGNDIVLAVGANSAGRGRAWEESANGGWRAVSIPEGAALRDIAATSAGAWVVGDSGRILRRTATGWVREVTNTTRNLQFITMRADGAGFATGAGGLILERRDTTWDVLSDASIQGAPSESRDLVIAPTGRRFFMLWSAIAPWATTDVLEFNAGTWTPLPRSSLAGRAGSLVMLPTGELLVAGNENNAFNWYVARYAGSNWQRVSTSPTQTTNNSAVPVVCGNGDVIVSAGLGEIYRYGGGSLTAMTVPNGARNSSSLQACRSAQDRTVRAFNTVAGGALWRIVGNSITATGYFPNNAVLSMSPDGKAWTVGRSAESALRYDGQRWTPLLLGRTSTIGFSNGAVATDASGGAYFTLSGVAARYNNGVLQWSTTSTDFIRMWGPSLDALWGVGPASSSIGRQGLMRMVGGTWVNAGVPAIATNWSFNDLDGTGPDNIMAVTTLANANRVLRWNGTSFTIDTASTTGFYDRIVVLSPTEALLYGGSGALRWNGTRWSPLPVLGSTIRVMTGRAPGEYYAFASDRNIYTLQNDRWVSVGTTPELVNDARYVGNRALAVGQNGLVVYGTALR